MKKGGKEYNKFKKGERLTRKEAMLAQCYVCNGEQDGGVDCVGKDCPLYQFMPYRATKLSTDKAKRKISKAQIEAMQKGRGKKGA